MRDNSDIVRSTVTRCVMFHLYLNIKTFRHVFHIELKYIIYFIVM